MSPWKGRHIFLSLASFLPPSTVPCLQKMLDGHIRNAYHYPETARCSVTKHPCPYTVCLGVSARSWVFRKEPLPIDTQKIKSKRPPSTLPQIYLLNFVFPGFQNPLTPIVCILYFFQVNIWTHRFKFKGSSPGEVSRFE